MPKTSDMTILVACFTGNSGLTDYSVSLARQLSKSGPVELVTGKNIEPALTRFGFTVNRFFRRSRWYPLDIVRFAFHVLRFRPAVVSFQAQLKVPIVEGLLVSLFRWCGVRSVLTVHDVLPHYPKPWSRLEFGWFYRRFDRLVVHSDAARQALQDLGVDRPMLTVPHGVYDIFRLKTPSRQQARHSIGLENDADTFCVLFFGHLEPRKGLLEFLAIAKRHRDDARLKFVLAGKFDPNHHSPEVSAVLAEASLWPNVLLRNERIPFEDVENYFSAADLVAIPYREGSTSGVLKLALAFEVPVVASRVGDLPEQVPTGAGILIDAGPRMIDDLAQSIDIAVSQHKAMASAMHGAAARCNWGDIAQHYRRFLLEGLES